MPTQHWHNKMHDKHLKRYILQLCWILPVFSSGRVNSGCLGRIHNKSQLFWEGVRQLCGPGSTPQRMHAAVIAKPCKKLLARSLARNAWSVLWLLRHTTFCLNHNSSHLQHYVALRSTCLHVWLLFVLLCTLQSVAAYNCSCSGMTHSVLAAPSCSLGYQLVQIQSSSSAKFVWPDSAWRSADRLYILFVSPC